MKFTSLLSWLAVTICGSVTFLSCSDDWEEPYLHIQDEEISVKSSGGSLTIPIECNTHWQILSLPTWVSTENSEGNGSSDLLFEVATNQSSARTGKIVVAANAVMQTVELTQQASTSGTLSVKTGSCTVSGLRPNYMLTFDLTITSPHLASKAGVIYGGQTYYCSSIGSYSYVEVDVYSLNPYGITYQAFAVNAITGKYVYGSTKTVGE